MKTLFASFVLSTLAIAAPAAADTLASSTFDSSAEGWGVGEFTAIIPTTGIVYDPVNQLVSSTDLTGNSAFLASAAFLGDQSAAFGGTLSFDLATASNDGGVYSAVSLIGAGLTLYSVFTQNPGTTLTPFSFDLVGTSFKIGDPFGGGGTLASDAQLLSVLGDLDQLAILVDWRSGDDFTQLDNVFLASAPGPIGGVPEPATWAMMIGGIALAGGTLRRRARTTVSLA